MKKIKNLTVKVTYKVGLSELEVPDDVFEQFNDIVADGNEVESSDMEFRVAADWMSNHIREKDCYEWMFEIEELDE